MRHTHLVAVLIACLLHGSACVPPPPVPLLSHDTVADDVEEDAGATELAEVAVLEPPSRPTAPCVPVTGCRVVARHRLASPFARARGFYENARGLVASRNSDWQPHGHADDTVFVEVTEPCAVGTGFYIESAGRIWLPFAQSCGERGCGRGYTGWYFDRIRQPHRVSQFRPVGHGFFEDGQHVFDRDEIVGVAEADVASFHACEGPPEDADGATFHPSAQDARGVFGWGECGVLIRATD